MRRLIAILVLAIGSVAGWQVAPVSAANLVPAGVPAIGGLNLPSTVGVVEPGTSTPTASAASAPEGENGVAAINAGSGAAVGSAAGVSPGWVGSETLVFDDGVVVSLVTPRGVPGGGDDTVDLFRAVGVREFDAVQSSGKFLPSSREGLDGRQFAATFDEALAYADADLSKVAILKVTVDRSVLSWLDFSRTIDPLIFRSGVFTVQPGAQSSMFHAALRRIEQVL